MDFLLNRERYRQFADQQFETVRWQALVATAVGVAVGKWLPGIVPLNAVLGAAFTYFILVRLTQRPVLVQEATNADSTYSFGRSGRVVADPCQDGVITAIEPHDEHAVAGRVLDGEGGLAIAPFIEPHIHLDTTQTAGEPSWNLSGTLFEGIERWAERKALLTHEDVKQRAIQTLKWQIANGIQFVRTHVDVSDPNLVALKAMLEVREEMKEWVELRIVAFPQEGILSYPNGKALLEEALKLGADVIGAIPHFEFTREYGVESLHYIFDLAEKYQVLVDVHCDEIDDEQSRFIETLATLAYERGIGHRVTASHTTAMHSYNGAYASRLFRLLKMADINFVAIRW